MLFSLLYSGCQKNVRYSNVFFYNHFYQSEYVYEKQHKLKLSQIGDHKLSLACRHLKTKSQRSDDIVDAPVFDTQDNPLA